MTEIAGSPLSNRRIASLDAFRGFIMFSMLLHTFGLSKLSHVPVVGFIYSQLRHVPWVGFHFEDIILPSFLFIIGVSMELSESARIQRGDAPEVRFGHAMKRVGTLFGLGFLLSWISAGKPTIGPGVLQVLALSYFFGYMVVRRSLPVRFAVAVGLLFFYWFFIYVIPVPGAGRNSYVVYKNLVYFIDNTITGSTSRWGYLYTIITSVAVIIYGSIVANLLRTRTSNRRFMSILALFGIVGIVNGLVLHPVIPIIKRMFTSSYTLFACGLISILYLGFFWLMEEKNLRKWSFPFIVIGMNSIFIYMLNGLFRRWLVTTAGVFINPLEPVIGAWIYPACEFARIAALWLVCFWLYRRKIFFKI
ncbi:acyltransferase family protein [Candidatus Latescibacterota bacterium]